MARQLPANTTWCTFASQSNFSVYSFTGREEVNKPFEFSIELVSRSANENLTNLLGTEGVLSIFDRSGSNRFVHGLIREMEQLHTANRFTHYRCNLVPRLWYLDKIRDHRIFQHLSVDKIIEGILKEQGFTAGSYEFKLFYQYEPREYCVQYGETDLHFITRLCEEEGIYFSFEHTANGHKLCFSDWKGGPNITGESRLRYFPGSGAVADTAVVHRLILQEKVLSNSSSYREWNFTKPRLDLTTTKVEADKEKAPTPPGMDLEQYQYPHLYQLLKEGNRYAEIQLLRQLAFHRSISCESDVSRFAPAFTFEIYEHARPDINSEWWVFSVNHEGKQAGVLEHEAPDDKGIHYTSSIQAIPVEVRFVPAIEHHKNRVIGQQTAIITGPKGEEIYPDEYGRVKVQFFWDREGEWDENTTCWIRVSQGWAGTGFGNMAIPRIGHEVIVSFLEGDPDRPIITGRVYHALNQIPYTLPDNKTLTVFKSMSTPGKEDESRGFNELRINDLQGKEEIYVHGQKDMNLLTKNDWKEHILNDRHQTVDHNTYTRTDGETHELLKAQRKTEIYGNDNLKVMADSHTKIDDKWLMKVGTEVHVVAGQKLVLEAGTELSVKAGGAWIKLDPSGVHMGGSAIDFGGAGTPGNGSGAKPQGPDEAKGVETGLRPSLVAPVKFEPPKKNR